MSNKNLELWNKVCTTDPTQTKKVSIGARKYTSIAPQYQIRTATEQFGIYGQTWGLKDTSFSIIDMPDQTKLLTLTAFFFAPNDTVFPVNTSMVLGEWKMKEDFKTKKIEKKYILDIDAYKKLETDATTKALSKLGFNADVFMGMFDDSRYAETAKKVDDLTQELNNKDLEVELSFVEDLKALQKFYLSNRWISTNTGAFKVFSKRRQELQTKKTKEDATK